MIQKFKSFNKVDESVRGIPQSGEYKMSSIKILEFLYFINTNTRVRNYEHAENKLSFIVSKESYAVDVHVESYSTTQKNVDFIVYTTDSDARKGNIDWFDSLMDKFNKD